MTTLSGYSARQTKPYLHALTIAVVLVSVTDPMHARAECNNQIPDEPVEDQVSPFRATGSSVAIRQDGNFLVTWSQRTNPGFFPAVFQIRAQRYYPSGLAQGTHADLSEDANENGIPDECEGEMMMMGGGEGGGESATQSEQSGALQSPEEDAADEVNTGDSPVPQESGSPVPQEDELPLPHDEDAAWEVFYNWVDELCWGGDCEESTAEQFRRMIDKKRELGLPL